MVMDYCSGGDLRYQLPRKYFNQAETKFLMSCVISALEYVHQHNIIHRDLKPENLVFQSNGYIKITDFGIARKLNEDEQKDGIIDGSGTPGYMAPEVMCRLKHNYLADYYALGIMMYEIMFRKRPYNG